MDENQRLQNYLDYLDPDCALRNIIQKDIREKRRKKKN
jgi:hypothetical protein